jgi:chemotaxis protein methyltransferase CheR
MKTGTLSNADFERLRSLIYDEAGIALTKAKRTMVEIRLTRRLRRLNIDSFAEYFDRLFSPRDGNTELIHLIDVITTNKTDFFREPGHFDYLVSRALPELAERKGTNRKCLVWSAGCSTGEEPYTLAMVLAEYARNAPDFRYSLLATDICTDVLAKATAGIFKAELVRPVARELQRKYLMRSRDPESDLVRIVPELRSRIEFRRLNLMDADYGLTELPEIVFCRNVIIYFDRPTQVKILGKLVHQLLPGGFFFAGHSESLQGMELPLVPVAPSVYRKLG